MKLYVQVNVCLLDNPPVGCLHIAEGLWLEYCHIFSYNNVNSIFRFCKGVTVEKNQIITSSILCLPIFVARYKEVYQLDNKKGGSVSFSLCLITQLLNLKSGRNKTILISGHGCSRYHLHRIMFCPCIAGTWTRPWTVPCFDHYLTKTNFLDY